MYSSKTMSLRRGQTRLHVLWSEGRSTTTHKQLPILRTVLEGTWSKRHSGRVNVLESTVLTARNSINTEALLIITPDQNFEGQRTESTLHFPRVTDLDRIFSLLPVSMLRKVPLPHRLMSRNSHKPKGPSYWRCKTVFRTFSGIVT